MGIGFYGQIYAKSDTAAADTGRRFETSEKKLSWCVIQISTQSQVFGTSSAYPVTYAAGTSFEMEDVDISTLYFANAAAGQNGTVAIMGILAEG